VTSGWSSLQLPHVSNILSLSPVLKITLYRGPPRSFTVYFQSGAAVSPTDEFPISTYNVHHAAKMLRTAAARPLARSLQTTSLLRQPCRISSSRNQVKTQLASNNRNFSLITANLRSIALRQAPTRSVTLRGTAQLVTTWVRHKSDTKKYPDGRPPLKPTSDPDSITVTSSTHPILSEVGQGGSAQKQTDADKASGIRSDLVCSISLP
jgi:hypothetical protein